MDSATLRRILLLALLPVVALLIYVDGQRFDPALLHFSGDAQSGWQETLLPERVGAFVRSTPLRLFAKDNLYEYINGHAEYFLSAGFESLVVGEYLREGSPAGQAELVADIYDMGQPLYAATILSDELGGAATPLSFGALGSRTGQGLSFVSGKYYVRIGVFRADTPAEEFAAAIHALIAPPPITGAAEPEARLPDLPGAGPIHFVKEAYRGLDFANNIQERDYKVGETTVQVALATGSPAEVERLRAAYLAFFAKSKVAVKPLTLRGLSLQQIVDPYEGDWYLLAQPTALFGIYGVQETTVLEELLAALLPVAGAAKTEAP